MDLMKQMDQMHKRDQERQREISQQMEQQARNFNAATIANQYMESGRHVPDLMGMDHITAKRVFDHNSNFPHMGNKSNIRFSVDQQYIL